MARHVEPLDGGLVTVKDPAMLKEGQLAYLRNGIYLPGDPALYRAYGRTSFGTVSATAVDVVGLRDIQFDNGNHYLLAVASSTAYRAPVGDSGSFTSMAAFSSVPSQLEVAHYRNRFYLFGGISLNASAASANGNLVAYLTATATANTPSTRTHGLKPVESTPVTSTGSGTFSQTVTGYYEYWTTELVSGTQDGAPFFLESTFSGNPATVYVSATGVVPMIARPPAANPSTTHWRVYRSTKKDKASDKVFPTGFLISSDISIAATSMKDTATVTSTGAIFPANFNGISDSATIWIDMGAQATALASNNNVDGTMSVTNFIQKKRQGVYGFNFGGFTGPVHGIEVVIEALVDTGTSQVDVTLVRKRQADGGIIPPGVAGDNMRQIIGELLTRLNTVTKSFSATTVRTAYTLGSSTDRWFASDNPNPLKDSDFGTDFMVVISFNDTVATTLSVDYVTVNVYYGGSLESTTVFPTVAYTFGDITAQVGKNGPPPSASTADFYEDTLVTNDVDNPAVIRYSAPGEPDSFPATYYVDFETRDNDRVTLVKTVNDRLIVGLKNSLWRMNYLPSERDASFDRGKSKQPISRTNGVINPMCACTFTRDGGQEELAFVSQKGIHTTDGYNFNTRSGNINWRGMFSTSSTGIALINDPETEKLRFLFQNDSFGNETMLELQFGYAKGDVDADGNFKVGGPVHLRNYSAAADDFADLKAAWSVTRANGATTIYYGYGGAATAAGAGTVYRETTSFTGQIPAQEPRLTYQTRRMYLAGFGNEWRLDQVYGYTGSFVGSYQLTYTASTSKTNTTTTTGPSKSAPVPPAGNLHRVNLNTFGEGITISAIATASAFRQEFLILEGKNFGNEDSGR